MSGRRAVTVQSRSVEQTLAVARRLGEAHPDGAVYYLEGDLGAGKTLFTKGIAEAYGVSRERVVSPTFALVNRYGEGKIPVYHVDLYRIETERELAELGLEELDGERAAVVVEWAEKLGRYRRADAVAVRIEILDDDRRRIWIEEPQQTSTRARSAPGRKQWDERERSHQPPRSARARNGERRGEEPRRSDRSPRESGRIE